MQTEHVKEMYQHFNKSTANDKADHRSKGTRTGRRSYSLEEIMKNGFCVFWNQGTCTYGDFCRFAHIEAPECRFAQNCFRKSSCRFSHTNKSFLGRRTNNQNQF